MTSKWADVGVPVAVALAMALTITVAREDDATRAPGVLAYVLGATVGGLLVARRRWPMGVLIGSIGLLMIYYALDYPAFSPAVPLAAAAYFAALYGHTAPAAALLAAFVALGAGWRTVGEGTPVVEVLGAELLTDAALLAAVLALGTAVRHRRAWAEEVREGLERAERERRREAERRAQDERLHIARELHDVVAHTIAGLNVQAGVAADVIDDDPRQAKAALSAIRRQAREAVAELRTTIGVLRGRGSHEPERAPAPGLADLDTLVSTTAAAGVQTSVAIAGTARELPSAIDLTAYRIVQESLTNVVRHADASTARVLLRYEPDTVVVCVEDDGHGTPNGAGGHGIAGMRERAAAIGGTLAAGPRAGGGFRVQARLPTRGEQA